MSKAGKKSSTQITPAEARALLVKVYGAARKADELLCEAIAAGRVRWGAQLKIGPAHGPEFWRSARIDYNENSARVPYQIFVPGDGRDPPATAECYGIWLSRADVLALLTEVPSEDTEEGWQVRRVRLVLPKLYPPDGKVPDEVPTATVEKRVGQELAADSKNRGVKPPSWDAVKSALGRGK